MKISYIVIIKFVNKETRRWYTCFHGNIMQGGNIMNTVLINLFVTYMKKQEILYKLTKDEKLHGYN